MEDIMCASMFELNWKKTLCCFWCLVSMKCLGPDSNKSHADKCMTVDVTH